MKNKNKNKKEKLDYMERDSDANYDIDGVSYDGEDVHVGSESDASKDRPKKSEKRSGS